MLWCKVDGQQLDAFSSIKSNISDLHDSFSKTRLFKY